MIHVFMRNRVKTRRKAIKIKPAQSRGKEWMSASRQQVCDELSRAESFLAGERKDRAGTAVPSLGIKRVLSSRGCGVVVTARLYTGLRLLAIYHPFLSACFIFATFDIAKNSRKSDVIADWTDRTCAKERGEEKSLLEKFEKSRYFETQKRSEFYFLKHRSGNEKFVKHLVKSDHLK